eukprot:6163690-Pleurochrysis_carterae.AAC.3
MGDLSDSVAACSCAASAAWIRRAGLHAFAGASRRRWTRSSNRSCRPPKHCRLPAHGSCSGRAHSCGSLRTHCKGVSPCTRLHGMGLPSSVARSVHGCFGAAQSDFLPQPKVEASPEAAALPTPLHTLWSSASALVKVRHTASLPASCTRPHCTFFLLSFVLFQIESGSPHERRRPTTRATASVGLVAYQLPVYCMPRRLR